MAGEAVTVRDDLLHPGPTQRPSSQPPSTLSHKQRKRRSSDKRMRNSDAPHVMSSIIASLDGIPPPIVPTPYAFVSGRDSPRSISSISNGAPSHVSSRRTHSIPAPALRRSISLGTNYSLYQTSIDEELGHPEQDEDQAAAFPVIRTSRRPSGKSLHTASSPQLGNLNGQLLSMSGDSKSTPSLNGSESAKHKLGYIISRPSVESWSRRLSLVSQLSMESTTDTFIHKTSSRRPSRDILKPSSIREERVAALVGNYTPATPERELPSPPSSPATPGVARRSPSGGSYSGSTTEGTVVWPERTRLTEDRGHACPPETSAKSFSWKKSPVADAIPLRVSSLNRTPSPRKDKSRSKPKSKLGRIDKGKRIASPFKEDSPCESTNVLMSNAQNIFEGLDEQDTTVRRIRELKQKKEDRLKKESAAASKGSNDRNPDLLPISSLPQSTDAKPTADSRLDRSKSTPKTATRISAREPDVRKAHKVLGLNETSKQSEQSGYIRYQENWSGDWEQKRQPPLEFFGHKPQSIKSLASFNANPPLRHSLEEVFATQEGDGPLSRRAETRLRLLNGLDLEAPNLTPPSTSHSSRSRHSRSSSNNLDLWSNPDLFAPTNGSKTSRRKSMSDARNDRILEEEILEERRNSVNISVEDYLNAPRLNQKIRHPQNGRLISFSEVGDPHGAAVIVCVGMGLTRFVSAFYDELATTLGLRLITLDRPGVGESEPYPERERIGPLSWPDDVVTVTQHLRISQFSILAHSAGAIYALATALILPHCIRGKVQLLAPWIPPSQFDTYGIKDRSPAAMPVGALPRSQRFLRVLPIPFLKAANGGLFSPSSLKPSSVRNSPAPGLSSPTSGLKHGRPKRRQEPLRRESMILMDQVVPEKPVATMFPLPELAEDDISGLQPLRRPSLHLTATATPTDPDLTFVAEALDAAEHSARERQSAYSTLLTERTWTLATHNSNPAVDLLVCLERHRDIGFRYVDIQRQMIITHGSEDKRVPVENIKWIGEQINRRAATNWSPDAKQEFRERGGCEVRVLPGEGHGLMASPGVMADVLAEIRREWTGTKWSSYKS